MLSCTNFRTRNSDEARLHQRVGLGLLNSGNLPGAFTELLEAEKLDSEDPSIQNSLGLAYFMRENYELSEKHFKNALSLKSDFSEAKNNLARVWIERGQYDQALTMLKSVMEDVTYPSPEKPLLNSGLAHFKKGSYSDALRYFRKSLDMDRENCFAQSYYGRTLYEMKDYTGASAALDRAVGFCQRMQFDEPHYFAALAYYHAGDESRATARLEEVTKLYPGGTYAPKAQLLLKQMRK